MPAAARRVWYTSSSGFRQEESWRKSEKCLKRQRQESCGFVIIRAQRGLIVGLSFSCHSISFRQNGCKISNKKSPLFLSPAFTIPGTNSFRSRLNTKVERGSINKELYCDVKRSFSKIICVYLYEEKPAKYIIYTKENREYIYIACYLAFSENIEVF